VRKRLQGWPIHGLGFIIHGRHGDKREGKRRRCCCLASQNARLKTEEGDARTRESIERIESNPIVSSGSEMSLSLSLQPEKLSSVRTFQTSIQTCTSCSKTSEMRHFLCIHKYFMIKICSLSVLNYTPVRPFLISIQWCLCERVVDDHRLARMSAWHLWIKSNSELARVVEVDVPLSL
jgi:hypothetical protein